MIRIAFVLSVFSNPKQANYFIRQVLAYEGSQVFVHVDKKALSIIPELVKDDRVVILPEHYDVSWSEFSQIQAYNYMFRAVDEYSKDAPFDYVSLNSGNDLLIRPMDDLIEYLQQTDCYAYYNGEPLPKSYWQYRGGFGRICLRWPKCFLTRLSDHHPLRYLRTIYGMLYHYHLLPGQKLPKDIVFYGGNDWFTLSGKCLSEMVEYIDAHPEYTRLYEHSYIGTEIYYVTLFNLLKTDRKVVDKNNLRFVDWKQRGQKHNAGSPNILTMECLPEIEASERFFGRKFDWRMDEQVVLHFTHQ